MSTSIGKSSGVCVSWSAMSQQHAGEIRKPTPRRLFSLDSLKPSGKRTDQPTSVPTQLDEPVEHLTQVRPWITSPDRRDHLTSSPVQDAPPAPAAHREHPKAKKVLPFLNTTSTRSGSPDSGSLPSPPQARWDHIRQHVFKAAGRSTTPPASTTVTPPSAPLPPPPIPPFHHQQSASVSSSVTSLPAIASASASVPARPPSRSQTPKPGSRLAARFGFKQVVEHAREAAVDENRKFAEDVLRACWATRSVDHSGHPGGKGKHGDTMTTGAGASGRQMYLPFTKTTMSLGSNVSGLGTSGTGMGAGSAVSLATVAGSGTKKTEQRYSGSGYPYTLTFASTSMFTTASASALHLGSGSGSGTGVQYTAPSVRYIHQVLWQASGSTTSTLRSVYLPHESLVLSSLLIPFTSISSGVEDEALSKIEEERWLSLDTFEVLIKTWPPANELASVERCLWCAKATLLAPVHLRSRILGALWGLTIPSENNHMLMSPDAIHSVANSVFVILPLATSQSRSQVPRSQMQSQDEISNDLKIIKDIIEHLSSGALDEDAVEEEYDAKWDSQIDTAEDVRRLMLSEAVMRCIEMCEREVRIWLLQHAVEEHWFRSPERPTALQTAISSRQMIHFCNGVLSILSSLPHELRHDLRTTLMNRIVLLLEKLVIPEVMIIGVQANGKDKEGRRDGRYEKKNVALEAVKSVTRVIVEILCYPEDIGVSVAVRWAVGVVSRWYSPPGSGGGGRGVKWKDAFEEMLEHLIANAEWATIVHVLIGVVNRVPDSARKIIVQRIFPGLTDRLVQDPPPPTLLSSIRSPTTPSHSRSSSSYSYQSQSTPPRSQQTLTTLLTTLSTLTPHTFFKPLFTLAASSRELVLANALCVVCALACVVCDWWVRDAEMISVALMSDVPAASGDESKNEKGGGTLGQVLVMLELVKRLRALRRIRDASGGGSPSSSAAIAAALGSETARHNLVKFVAGLEVRLAVLIEAKEKTAPIPPMQRMLFCMLFREFRLLTRSLKPAPWLPTILRWLEQYFEGRDVEDGWYDNEIESRVEEVRNLYDLARSNASSLHKRRTFAMMPTTALDQTGREENGEVNLSDTLSATLKLIASLRKGFVPRVFKLLVTVSAMLSPMEWGRVAPVVWYHGILSGGDDGRGGESKKEGVRVMSLVCFLVMQCAEKNPLEFTAMVEVDMRSSDDLTRLESVHKLSLLVNWRFQLMSESHNILVDRTHRPFRLARAPLPFVPTDIGSPNYIHNPDSDFTFFANGTHKARVGTKGNMKDAIPTELRRQLVEIGWVDDEGEGDEKEVWIRTPVAMLPVTLIERLDAQRTERRHHHSLPAVSLQPNSADIKSGPPGASASTTPDGGGAEGELLRRNSSSGGPTYAKRRAVFVPPLTHVFRVLATMVYDPNYAVAAAARDTLLDLMRNDPGLLLRPVLDMLCAEQGRENGNQKDVPQAVNMLTALLHTRAMLPPPMSHAIFNNLAGFLKYALRQTDSSSLSTRYPSLEMESTDALRSFALTVPIMAQLARYVGDLSIREIRRSKMEHFLIPYGTLWFGHAGVPNGPMFPKGPGDLVSGGKRKGKGGLVNPFESVLAPADTGVDPKLVSVVMIRIAQNMLFVDMLRKNAQDVVLVRKTMPRFVLPSLGGSEGEESGRVLELSDFVPFRKTKSEFPGDGGKAAKTLKVLSLALARSYVTLVAQVFRSMSRNSNDREEMSNFVDGLNRILLAHGDDIGIVGHVLIAFMVASARFRRLFTSGGGYSLFMPALVKVYAELHQRIDIKLAIEYAVYRFYALHREAFLFQSVDAIAHVAALPETDVNQYATRVYELFYSLRNGVTPTSLDPAGIHNVNQSQEKEAVIFHAAEDKPQTFLTAIRRGEAQTNGQIFFDIPDSYENSRLRMEDLVKLFLTIIAHDPSILRAQYFMRMFRFLAPHLYNASPQARNVLQDGLVALGDIQLKALSKSKMAEASSAVRVGEADVTVSSGAEASDKTKSASNPNVMRLDFLLALTNVAQAGSHIPTAMARQAIEIAKLILKDTPSEMLEPLSSFFADLTKLVILRGELSKPKFVMPFLQALSPVIRTYITILDFASVFETITQVSSTLPYAHDPVFARLVIHDICAAGLEVSERVTSGTELSNRRFRTALVPLLAEGIFLRGADVVGELEKHRPSFHFLAKVVLPLALTLKTTDHLTSESARFEPWHRSSLTSSWIRLLFYAMTACQRSFRASGSLPLSRSKSRDKRSGDEKQWQTHLPTFVAALQIIKVIVIRAETEISTTLPDLWHRLAAFLKSVLMDGNANFALHGSGFNDFSPLPSPTPSPRASNQLGRSAPLSSSSDLPGQSTADTSSIVPYTLPRAIDYALWSTLEFLCAYRSPLRLQLRLFTVEKVVSLDQELRHRQRRVSPFASPNTSTTSRRVSTSVFAKPRRSALFPSPDSTPHVSRSPSMIHESSIPSIHLDPRAGSLQSPGRGASLEIPPATPRGELRLPGYQYTSPVLSHSTPKQGAYIQVEGEAKQGPRIIHLGPTSPSALIPPTPLSPSGGGSMGVNNIRLMAQSTTIKSLELIKATYRRIRTVQTFMGYDTLLPLPPLNPGLGIPGLEMEGDEISIATWTRRSALEAVLTEMKQLEKEFEEVVKDIPGANDGLGDDSVFAGANPTSTNILDQTIIA